MAKYIIYVPSDLYEVGGRLRTPIKVGNGDMSWYDTDLRVEPYTEPDRKAIEDEVWGFARHLINMSPSVTEDIYRSMNGGKGIGVAVEMTYQEAKAEYDAWRKEKEEIHVGDEVEAESGNKACVLYENPDGTQMFVFQADGIATWWSKCAIHKTGKNHPEVAELLKKMGDTDED